MKFRLTIECDNAAFDDNPHCELARILRELADKLVMREPSPGTVIPLHDVNGNRVGDAALRK